MAQWINISTDDINNYIDSRLLDKLRTAAIYTGQSDPVVAIIADVCRRIRTELRGNPINRVSQTLDTIPPELKAMAIALIVEAAYTRLPGIILSDAQQNAANEARNYLERIARGEVPVSTPDDPEEPDDVQRALRIETVKYRTKRMNSARLSRLT